MAHFANIENNIVTQVVVVDSQYEGMGQEYLNSLGLPGRWIQTSYNAKIRKIFASVGDTYDDIRDVFIPYKPFNSWIWNEDSWSWDSPIEYPDDSGIYVWDEDIATWKSVGE